MLKLFLWLRYLHKRRIVFLAIAAVALSCAILVVTSSLFNGFIDAVEKSATKTMGDIVIEPPVNFKNYSIFAERLKKLNSVKAVCSTLSSQGLIHLGDGNVRAVYIVGIEPESQSEVTGLKNYLLQQKSPAGPAVFETKGSRSAAFVGIGVIASPDEKTDEYNLDEIKKSIGREAVVTMGAAEELKRKTLPVSITDIVFTGVYYLDDMFVYLPMEQLQQKLYPKDDCLFADQVHIKLTEDASVDSALAAIRDLWRLFAVEQLDWENWAINNTIITTAVEKQKEYIRDLQKQLGALLFIFGIVSFSIVILIWCIFYMIVETKLKDIAILKSCGTGAGSVALIFIGFGGCIGVVGSACGTALGYLITRNINTIEEWIRIVFGLKLWKSSVYIFNVIPNRFDWSSVVPIVVLAILAAVLGSLIPAIIAARTRPVNVLRYE